MINDLSLCFDFDNFAAAFLAYYSRYARSM